MAGPAAYIGAHKISKSKVAFHTTLYGLAGIQLWDFVTWLF